MSFVNRDPALAQGLYFRFIVIDTDDLVAHLGEANRRNKSNISGADDTDGD